MAAVAAATPTPAPFAAVPAPCIAHATRLGPLLHHLLLTHAGVDPEADFALDDDDDDGAGDKPVGGVARVLPAGSRRILSLIASEHANRPELLRPPGALLVTRADGTKRRNVSHVEAACASLFVCLRLEYTRAAPVVLARAELVAAHRCPPAVRAEFKHVDMARQVVCWIAYDPRPADPDDSDGGAAAAAEAMQYGGRAANAQLIPRALHIEDDALQLLLSECPRPPATLPGEAGGGSRRHRAAAASGKGHGNVWFAPMGGSRQRRRSPVRRGGGGSPSRRPHSSRDIDDFEALLGGGPRSQGWLLRAGAAGVADGVKPWDEEERERRRQARREAKLAAKAARRAERDRARQELLQKGEELQHPPSRPPWQLHTPPLTVQQRHESLRNEKYADLIRAAQQPTSSEDGSSSETPSTLLDSYSSTSMDEAATYRAARTRNRHRRRDEHEAASSGGSHTSSNGSEAADGEMDGSGGNFRRDSARAQQRRLERQRVRRLREARVAQQQLATTARQQQQQRRRHVAPGRGGTEEKRPAEGLALEVDAYGVEGADGEEMKQPESEAGPRRDAEAVMHDASVAAAMTQRLARKVASGTSFSQRTSSLEPAENGATVLDAATVGRLRSAHLASMHAAAMRLVSVVSDLQLHAEQLDHRVAEVESRVTDAYASRDDLRDAFKRSAVLIKHITAANYELSNLHYRIYSMGAPTGRQQIDRDVDDDGSIAPADQLVEDVSAIDMSTAAASSTSTALPSSPRRRRIALEDLSALAKAAAVRWQLDS